MPYILRQPSCSSFFLHTSGKLINQTLQLRTTRKLQETVMNQNADRKQATCRDNSSRYTRHKTINRQQTGLKKTIYPYIIEKEVALEQARTTSKYPPYAFLHTSTCTSTGQWSDPKMSVCMAAERNCGRRRSDTRK